MQHYYEVFVEHAIVYVPRVALAIVVLLVGLWLIRRANLLVQALLSDSAADPTLAKFATSFITVSLKALLFISVASMVGIETTSFLALLGAAGLAVGLALQGSLANFAGGVLILMFRPFRVGEFIEAQGISGSVKEIRIFFTVLNTPDNKLVTVPNGLLSNGIITNYSREATRRIDLVFGISFDDNIATAKELLQRLLSEEVRVLVQPAPNVAVAELVGDGVNLRARFWVAAADLSAVRADLIEAAKLAFDAAGISRPYPRLRILSE